MNDLEMIFLMFLLSLASIVVGIVIGFGMGQRHILRQLGREYADTREDVKRRAFNRLDRARESALGTTMRPDNGSEFKAHQAAIRRESILDAEVIE